MNVKTKRLTQASIIAACYVVLTFVANSLGLANGAIQVRFSESLTILPVFTPAAVPGLFIGCLISNILSGCAFFDIVFGSLATLIGAIFTRILRKQKFLAPVPPILSNMLIIPFVLKYTYGLPGGFLYFAITVGLGEIISCGALGTLLMVCLKKYENVIKW